MIERRCLKNVVIFFKLFVLLFLPLNFDFTIFIFWYSIKFLGNKLGSSTIGQFEKTSFTAEFLTVANTMNSLHEKLKNKFSFKKMYNKQPVSSKKKQIN